MFQHYDEGDRIITNEPCLNCTCHDSMLMCFLKVCPFAKPIGQDCQIEKRPDQCCPIITCPERKSLSIFKLLLHSNVRLKRNVEAYPWTSLQGAFLEIFQNETISKQ